MESTPAAAELPIQMPHRHGRLILLVSGFVLLIAALWWLLFALMRNRAAPGNPFLGWLVAISAATVVGLLLFAVVTALLDMRQRSRWLVVFAALIAESLLLTTGELVAFADYRWANLIRLVSWQGSMAMQLIIGLGTVLTVHILLWPFRAILGWQVHWAGELPSDRERLLTIWHLAGWVALIAILVIGSGSTMNSGLMVVAVLLAEFAALLAGLPVLILASRRKHLLFWIPVVLAGLIGLSLVESELAFFITKATGSGSGIPVWFLGIWNGAVAGTVLLAVFLLRWAGLVFHLPMSHREAALRRAPAEGMPANSLARREFQFSLRSLLILTTLLCLGPGGYIAWEREQCRRGSEILSRIEKLGGKVQSIYQPRPAWLQTVIGDNAFRNTQYISLEKTGVVDADLALLSSLPNLETLTLNFLQVTDAGLASLSCHKNLRHLGLDETKVTDAGLVHLSGLTNLKSMGLAITNVSDKGMVHLSPLVNLESLSLDATAVGDAGLPHLPAGLKTLGLTYTKVGDAGLAHLPADLKCLRLAGTKVTDAGLVAVSRLTNLEELHLHENQITDTGLAHLERLPKLKTLMIMNTQVTDVGAVKLNKKLPALKIHR